MKSYSIERARHLVLRAAEGDVLPDDVARVLGDQGVTSGWIRASGVLTEVELRVFDASIGGPAEARRIAGPVQALSIEGSVGLDGGEPSMGLRAVLARETDRGMEVLAGEIVAARVVALEAYVTGFEDLSIGRTLDALANVVLFGDAADARYRPDDDERPRAAAAPGCARLGMVGRDRRERGKRAAAPGRAAAARSAERSRLAPCECSEPMTTGSCPRPATSSNTSRSGSPR